MGETAFTTAWGATTSFRRAPNHENFGNLDLTALRAEHAVAGLNGKLPDGWSLNVEVYRKRLWNLPVEDPVLNFVNGARGWPGVELLVKKDRTARWAGWFAVSQSHSTRKNERTGQEVNFSQDQPWVLNLVATRRVDQFYSVGLRAQYHSGAPDTPITGTYVDGTGRVRPVRAPRFRPAAGLPSNRPPVQPDFKMKAGWAISTSI
ncbi:MAG: TonB-dependent receptor [Elusimicrobia bacterium]|nr:TonB-dependent receptor [Elusimicrobiota bacterium]